MLIRAIVSCLILANLALPVLAEDISVCFPRFANTFYAGETVSLTVRVGGEPRAMRWAVRDYWNGQRRGGWIRGGGDRVRMLTLDDRLPCGYYRFLLDDDTHHFEDTFCVIPRPYDDPGDYTLFGLHPGDGATEENLAAAAQVGVRVIRQNIPWPVFEPERGVYDHAWLEDKLALGRKYGLQMMFVLGFTPRWAGEKPENYLDDWVNAAWFTWHPREPMAWGKYLDQVTGALHGQTVQWPCPYVLPQENGPRPVTLPLTHSWELWNEADICFYVGDWGRYNDLLHMAWAKTREAVPDAPMIYGGSTGNFIAMGVTASGSARYCFDYVALHTGGDLEDALRVWYGGAQQIPWIVGAPRETMHTECYAQGRRGAEALERWTETPAEMRRCYLTLKAWREQGYYRSGCLGGWIDAPGVMAPGTTMLHRNGAQLSPTPLYPAFACTRKLLSDATEVGPVNLGNGITAHCFLKHGSVMLSAWADDGAQTSLSLAPAAYEVDVFGGRRYFKGQKRIAVTLDSQARVFIGADPAVYLPLAIAERYRLLSQTPYGTPQINPECGVWYTKPLNDDLTTLLDEGAATRLAAAVGRAGKQMGQSTLQGPQAASRAQVVCTEVMQQVLTACPRGQELPPKAADALWRLARLSEWLGEVADDRSSVWSKFRVTDQQVAAQVARLYALRATLRRSGKDADYPCAQQLLDRALRQAPRLQQFRRRGTYAALAQKATLAEALLTVEKPYVLRVTPVVDFTTARCFRKARLLEPGRTHTLTVWVQSALDHTASGTLTLKLPATWEPAEVTVPFTARAGEASEPVPVQVTLPANPIPWNDISSFTMDGWIKVSLPQSLSDRPILEVQGKLSTGEELSPMAHFVNVGRWLDDPATTAPKDALDQQKGGSFTKNEPPAQLAARQAAYLKLFRLQQP